MEHSQIHPPSFFFSFFVTGTKGGTGVGAEIGNERSGQNCGRGSEGKRRSEEGSVVTDRLTAIYVNGHLLLFPFDVC